MNTTGNDTVLIRDLSLGTKTRNCLRRAEITTAAELVTWTEYELLRDVHGLGRGALAEITDALAKWGWALRKQARRVVSWGARSGTSPAPHSSSPISSTATSHEIR